MGKEKIKKKSRTKVEEKERYFKNSYKPKQEPEPVESIEDKDYGKPIAQPGLEAVVGKMMNLAEKYPTLKDGVINKFKNSMALLLKQLDILT